MVKNITLTKRIVIDWLVRSGYRREDIVFNRRSSPDFILPDGRKIEVKRLAGSTIYFTPKQWESLTDDVEVVVVKEDMREPVAIVPFSMIRKVAESGIGRIGNLNIIARRPGKTRVIHIWCDEDLYRTFMSYSANYKDHAEALRELMVRAGVYRKPPTF
ncbi:MAG: hypothetical protein QXY41_05995 [Thermoproteota archaeon]